METELLATFDEKHQKTGENSREFVHKKGLWHETFHCWFVHFEKGLPQIYFQQRSNLKKDFPNLFDITAAGHLLANETVNDGIREVKEELGINLSMNDLHSIGIVKDRIFNAEFIDNEFAHTYLYIMKTENLPFRLQQEEVAGIYAAALSEVTKLYEQQIDHIILKCISSDANIAQITVKLNDFVPHGIGYMEQVLNAIRQIGGAI